MEKVVNSYETLFVVNPTLAEDELKAVVDKFTALIAENGTVGEIDEWGKRRLAYPINDINEGYYVVVTFKSAPDFPAELERVFGITDGIMRSVVIKLDEKMLAKKAARAAQAKTEAVEEKAEEVAEATDAE